jgi:hypothetical protein
MLETLIENRKLCQKLNKIEQFQLLLDVNDAQNLKEDITVTILPLDPINFHQDRCSAVQMFLLFEVAIKNWTKRMVFEQFHPFLFIV